MRLKKYMRLLMLSLVLAFGLNISAVNLGGSNPVIIKAYAKKKAVKKDKKDKKDEKVFRGFIGWTDADDNAFADNCYIGKNNKLYMLVEDFFGSLKGSEVEAKIEVNVKKKLVKVMSGKEYKAEDRFMKFKSSIYGKPQNIKIDVDGRKFEVKGYVVKPDKGKTSIFVDFDELAKKLGLSHDKSLTGRYVLFAKLPEHSKLIDTDGSLLRASGPEERVTEINPYDISDSWASPIGNYLYEEDGNLVIVETKEIYAKPENKYIVVIKRYSASGNLLDEKSLKYQGEIFGGFYRGEKNNYLIFGNNNEKADDSKEVIRIVKFDRAFNQLGKLSINGAFTITPFDAGSLRCAQIGQTILVHTSRGRYDGHQSQLTIAFDEESMTLLNADNLGESQPNDVSHDFNQFVMADGNEFVLVDHGDAFPRSILVSWLNTPMSITNGNSQNELMNTEPFSPIKEKEVFRIPGVEGFNQTGISIGSTINMANKILIGVNRIDYSKVTGFDGRNIQGKDTDKRDIVLYSLDKNTLEVTENKYTDYSSEKNITYTAPKMVKIDDTRAMLIWNKIAVAGDYKDALQYLIVDDNGKQLSEIKTIRGAVVGDEAPIVYKNKVVWTDWRRGRLILHTIPLD